MEVNLEKKNEQKFSTWMAVLNGKTYYLLTGRDYKIGRSISADIIINDQYLSRHHALIKISSEGNATIYDYGSTNGIFLDEERVQNISLSDGLVVSLGMTFIKFKKVQLADSTTEFRNLNLAKIDIGRSEKGKTIHPLDIFPEYMFTPYIFEPQEEMPPAFKDERPGTGIEFVFFYGDKVIDWDFIKISKKLKLYKTNFGKYIYNENISKSFVLIEEVHDDFLIHILPLWSGRKIDKDCAVKNIEAQSVQLAKDETVEILYKNYTLVMNRTELPPKLYRNTIEYDKKTLNILSIITVIWLLFFLIFEVVVPKKEVPMINLKSNKIDNLIIKRQLNISQPIVKKEVPEEKPKTESKVDDKPVVAQTKSRPKQVPKKAKKQMKAIKKVVDKKSQTQKKVDSQLKSLFGDVDVEAVETSSDQTSKFDLSKDTIKTARAEKNIDLKFKSGKGTRGSNKVTSVQVSIPSIEASDAAMNSKGLIDPEAVKNFLEEAIPKFSYCYDLELERLNAKFTTGIKLDFEIITNGSIRNIKLIKTKKGLGQAFDNCMKQVLNNIRFPRLKMEGVVRIKQPITLRASDF